MKVIIINLRNNKQEKDEKEIINKTSLHWLNDNNYCKVCDRTFDGAQGLASHKVHCDKKQKKKIKYRHIIEHKKKNSI